jgi:hypothetical protein
MGVKMSSSRQLLSCALRRSNSVPAMSAVERRECSAMQPQLSARCISAAVHALAQGARELASALRAPMRSCIDAGK